MQFLLNPISRNAIDHPTSVAVQFEGQTLGYAELAAQFTRIGSALVARGIGRGDAVGVFLDRGLSLLPVILGVMASGAAFVPIDPAFPEERVHQIVKGASLSALICDRTKFSPLSSDGEIQQFEVNELLVSGSVTSSDPTELSGWEAHDIVYVMHTSGSTGVPKGVRITVANLQNFLESMREIFAPGRETRWLAVTTISFDISVLELLLPLLSGGTVVLASAQDIVDGHRIAQLLEHENITHLQATPATWRMMQISGWRGALGLTALCGGEAMEPAFARDLAPKVLSLWNMYGPTETTIWSTCGKIGHDEEVVSVGYPIANTIIKVVDADGNEASIGDVGELLIGGDGVCSGYTDATLNGPRFVERQEGGESVRYYRTGDLASINPDGSLRIHGRNDDQIKRHGFRIELGEINAALCGIEGVLAARAIVAKTDEGEQNLIAFCQSQVPLEDGEIRGLLSATLPHYMIPDRFLFVRELPIGPNGKVDTNSLKQQAQELLDSVPKDLTVSDDLPVFVLQLARQLTGNPSLLQSDNLFDAGLNSIQANVLASRLSARIGTRFPVAWIFEMPQIDALLQRIANPTKHSRDETTARESSRPDTRSKREPIAIVGMALRVPGAQNVDQFWEILKSGRDTVTRFTEAEDDPLVPLHIREDARYIRARGMIPDPDLFDAQFFGIGPNDARVMDPQQRVFLELAWEAFENAGYTAASAQGLVSVYAGMGNNFYYHYNVATNPDFVRMVGDVQAEIGREKDHIATLVSHKLNLTGPSLSIHTACSTGLVVVDAACHSLLSGQSDIAIAGAIELSTPQMSGQIGEPGGIFTEDGYCRPFSADASGTMFSDGAGVVVLKRLSDAVADGDRIIATIAATAVNHDGSQKKSYLAPNGRAQTEVIRLAHRRAGIQPQTIGYMEAHGTATPVGDPIEFEALLEAFGGVDAPLGSCALGSVKANLGHPTTAAGIVGIIKVALMLSHKTLVPLANFDGRINPSIDIENSPFFIPTAATPWSRTDHPRRAGVSSFGFCGTNAHAVVEEAPEAPRPYAPLPPREAEVFLLSAKTSSALKTQVQNLVSTITPETNSKQAAQAAFTLALGRTGFDQRSFGIWNGTDPVLFSEPLAKPKKKRPLIFLFPGQGTQYLGMGRTLARQEPAFRNALEEIAAEIRSAVGFDIREVMWETSNQGSLDDTRYTQPALFAIELALASYWESLGLVADGLVGHSVGEYSAAVLAGVMTRAQAARLVCRRAELMTSAQPGEMLAVRAPQAVLTSLLPSGAEIAVINGPDACVVGGPREAIAELQARVGSAGHQSKRLNTSHAFHTSAMAEAARQFEREVRETTLLPPQRPIISTVTGTVLKDTEACDPTYWSRQILQPVNYHGAISHVWHQGAATILEVGPGASLSRLASQSRQSRDSQTAFASLRSESGMECFGLAEATGKLWALGYEINWDAYFADRLQERVPLPTYPFERTSYWLDPVVREGGTVVSPNPTEKSRVPASEETASDDLPLNTASIIEDIRGFFEIAGAEFSDVPENSSFFDEGVDSLLLTQIIFMIQECYGIKVTFRDINQSLSTLETLARYIEAHIATADTSAVAVAKTDNGSRLSPNRKQRAMLAHMEGNVLGSQIDLAMATVSFERGLDVDKLSRALKQLAARHDALHVKLSADRQSWTDCGQTPTLITGVDRNAGNIGWPNPFADSDNPLWSATLNTTPSGHQLDIVASGLICDGWSIDLMLEDLASLYSGRPLGQADSLTTIAEADIRLLPPSRLDEATHKTFVLSAAALQKLREDAKNAKCSVFTVLLANVFLAMRDVHPSGELGLYLAAAGQATRNLPRLVTNCADALPVTINPERSCSLNSMAMSLGEQLAWIRDTPESVAGEENATLTLQGIPLVGLFVHIKSLSDNAQKFEGVASKYQLHPAPVLEADFQITMFESTESLELTFSHKRHLTVGDELRALFDALVHRLADTAPLESAVVPA